MFVPSIVTIFGVIMYLRFGWVLGQVGLPAAIAILTMASLITFLTGLSIAATATNMRVGGGGAYYMISRSFGVEAGAAIGIPLFFAQALGVSFYLTGFGEAVQAVIPLLPERFVAVAALAVMGVLAYRSADLALRVQALIFLIIMASLVSFFLGQPLEAADSPAEVVFAKEGFWAVFAVFFPAVTGILAGVAMSGELRDPSRALPMGTIAAVCAGFLVYLAVLIFLYTAAPREALLSDPLVMRRIALVGWLIPAGVFAATLSSGLGSILGAPRTLQALARDRVIFPFLGRGSGPADLPRVATLVSLLVALAGILLGDLNAIAPVLTMFFLTTYGFLNLAAGVEGFLRNPSWRPSFRTPWYFGIAGAGACLAVMLMINPGATIVATVLGACIFVLIKKRRLGNRWSDVRRGVLTALARYSVYELDRTEPDARTWRPNILVLSGSPSKRWHLIELADAITQGVGFLTVASVVPESMGGGARKKALEKSIKEFLTKRRIPALVTVHANDDVLEGAGALVENYGLSALAPNVVVLGDSEDLEQIATHTRLIRRIYSMGKNVLLVSHEEPPGAAEGIARKQRRIDVWWGRQRQNANLALALAYLLSISPEWRRSAIHLKTMVGDESERAAASADLERFVAGARLAVALSVYVSASRDQAFANIVNESRDADLVLLGMRSPDAGETDEAYGRYLRELKARTEGLPTALFVMAAEPVRFGEIFAG